MSQTAATWKPGTLAAYPIFPEPICPTPMNPILTLSLAPLRLPVKMEEVRAAVPAALRNSLRPVNACAMHLVVSGFKAPIRAATVRERLPRHLKFVRLEHAHGITLLGDDVLNGRRDMLWFPQPPRAAMACPSLTVRFIQPHSIRMAAGVSFEIAHDSLRRNLRVRYCMHVIASHVSRQQTPSTMRTHLLNRLQYGVATDLVQVIRRLIHAFPLESGARGIPFQNRGSRHIVYGVDGAGFAAVQVASVAGKGDYVNHGISRPF